MEPKSGLVQNLIRGHRRDGRNLYNAAAKRELVNRVLEPGVSLAATALAHGLNANLLRKWVDEVVGKEQRAGRIRQRHSAPATLLPVRMELPRAAPADAPAGGYVEIALRGATIRVHGSVAASELRVVLECVAAHA